MAPLLPREIVRRGKASFGLPIRAWLQDEKEIVNTYLNGERIKKQGLFRPDVVQRIMHEQTNGLADHANTLFTLLCQQIWLEENAAGITI